METKKFKPMLCPNEKVDLSKINYPMLASTKLDGIRTIFKDGHMLSRSLKEIPNKQLQKKFQNLKDYSKKHNIILDGELYGIKMSFQEITHFVMSHDLDEEGEELPEKLKFFAFDCITSSQETPFSSRYDNIRTIKEENLVIIKQKLVKSKEEVEAMFEEVLEEGFEGLILKSQDSKYKFGRATFNSGDAYKVKPFLSFDSKIIAIEERMENTGESFKNELGKSEKHHFKENLKPTGIAASFIVMYEGQEQKVNITGDESFRREIWKHKNNYIGKTIEYKGMLVGSKDKVRHPVFLRFRSDK